MKLRVTESEFLHSGNFWAEVRDQADRLWLYASQRRIRGKLLEITYQPYR